jgi:apolipoprotein N-acyltransferase
MSHQRPTSHFVPRTREGWIATIAFAGLFLLAMPPVSHRILDRPGTWVWGVPVLFFSLFVIYLLLIGVLVWALRKDI